MELPWLTPDSLAFEQLTVVAIGPLHDAADCGCVCWAKAACKFEMVAWLEVVAVEGAVCDLWEALFLVSFEADHENQVASEAVVQFLGDDGHFPMALNRVKRPEEERRVLVTPVCRGLARAHVAAVQWLVQVEWSLAS